MGRQSGRHRRSPNPPLETLPWLGGDPEAVVLPTEVADPTELQVLKCRVSGQRHSCHPSSYQERGCNNGRSTEDPASPSSTKGSHAATATRGPTDRHSHDPDAV